VLSLGRTCGGGTFSVFSVVQRRRGQWWRGRSSQTACGASARSGRHRCGRYAFLQVLQQLGWTDGRNNAHFSQIH
jgi:hypothetical protein